jgi:hypothetical protein
MTRRPFRFYAHALWLTPLGVRVFVECGKVCDADRKSLRPGGLSYRGGAGIIYRTRMSACRHFPQAWRLLALALRDYSQFIRHRNTSFRTE